MNAIEVDGLSRSFNGLRAVDNISFTVKAGEIFGFLGHNGAGKTTTIRMLSGQLQPSAGRARVASCDVITEHQRLKPLIGVVSENQNLYERMSGRENLVFASQLYGAGSADAIASEVEKQQAIGGLVVPNNFDADVAAGKQPEVKVYVNNQKSSFEHAAFRRLLEQQVLSLMKYPEPARLVWIDVAKEPGQQAGTGLNLNQMLLPLLLVMSFAMTGALVVPLLLVEEKEKRTLDFLLTSPASLTEIITGKALTGVAYSLLIAGLLLAINRQLIGNWPLTLLASLLGVLFVVAIGSLMGSFFTNTMQVNTWAGLIVFLLLTPSFPSPGMSVALETAMRLIPTHYLTEALRLSLAGNISSRFWGHLAIVAACTLIAFFAATWALRRGQN